MSKKKEAATLYVPLYKFYLHMFNTSKEARRASGSKFEFGKYGAAAFKMDDGNFGVYVPKYGTKECAFKNKASYIAALSHEALHLVHYVFCYIQQDNHGDEQDTYLLEYLVEWLILQSDVLNHKERISK